MTTTDDYIDRVLEFLPPGTPERDQIATELRGHIAERLAGGQSPGQVLQQLGDPLALAESYLSAVPLRSGSFGRRAVAKIVDIALILAWIVPIVCIAFFASPDPARPFVLFVGMLVWSLLAAAYLGRRGGAVRTDARQAADGAASRARVGRAHHHRAGGRPATADVPADVLD